VLVDIRDIVAQLEKMFTNLNTKGMEGQSNDDVFYINEGHQVRVKSFDWLKEVSGGEK